jgi:HSP20 family protein
MVSRDEHAGGRPSALASARRRPSSAKGALTMADLSKWFPFKFKRTQPSADKPEKSQVPARADSAQMSPGVLFPAFSPEMGRLMERMFSEPFFSRPFSALGKVDEFFGDFAPSTFSPSVDLVDEGTHLKVSAELPGLDKDDLELAVHEGMLTLRGEKRHEQTTDEEGCYRTERFFGSFHRTIPLPADVDLEKAEAKFDKGVLTVRFPKTQPPEPQRKIPVT